MRSCRPRACSGAMYAAVPKTTPSRVGTTDATPSRTRASPKSSTLTWPALVRNTFAGLISGARSRDRASARTSTMARDGERLGVVDCPPTRPRRAAIDSPSNRLHHEKRGPVVQDVVVQDGDRAGVVDLFAT